ncbi:universal stress protein [Haloferax sp. AB510]|uniref:universal stress protein n=1 Tax=Haloferax sp. AB510 TaxID=2934172 RepID=UPI00209C51E8|nr:universal stress protein [Haloferax sp. AB510]MCO8268673.1 universal stress protein [Haloferax sp. AB510]
MYLVAYDGSRLANAALDSAAQFASATGHDVLAVAVVPDDSAYAVEAGWVPSREVFDRQTVVGELHKTAVDIAPSASFQAVSVGKNPAPGNIVSKLRTVASETDATVIFVGSENAGRVVVPLVSVGGNVASDDAHDVHIVRHAPPEIHRRFPKSHFYLP